MSKDNQTKTVRILVISNVFFIGVAAFLGYKSLSVTPDDPPVSEKCTPCKDYSSQPFTGIPLGLAYNMVKGYKTSRWDNFKFAGETDPRDARSVWFRLDSVKKFIWNLENEVCKSGCIKPEDLGLRIYYAAYPDEKTWETMDTQEVPGSTEETTARAHWNQYQDLHTVVIAPTCFSPKTGCNVDFDPRYIDKKNCHPMEMKYVYKDKGVDIDTSQNAVTSGGNAFILAPDIRSAVKNQGSLIPPPPFSVLSGPVNIEGESHGADFIDRISNTICTYW